MAATVISYYAFGVIHNSQHTAKLIVTRSTSTFSVSQEGQEYCDPWEDHCLGVLRLRICQKHQIF